MLQFVTAFDPYSEKNMSDSSILLIHTTSRASLRCGALSRGAGRPAPLGLACLATSFPGRVTLLDLQEKLPEAGDIPASGATPFAAAIVAAAAGWQTIDAKMMLERLRQLLPSSRFILGGPRAAALGADWDATLHGTGRTACEWILKDPNGISGPANTLEADLRIPLGVPATRLGENHGYSAAAEKAGGAPTISVHQPWLGLLDRSPESAGAPTRGDLSDLFQWLHVSGYSCISIETPGLSGDRANQMIELASEHGMTLSLRFDRPEDVITARLRATTALLRVWLHPSRETSATPAAFMTAVSKLQSEGISIGIRLPVDMLPDDVSPLLATADELSTDHPSAWQQGLLRSHLLDFYWRRGRFWKNLWRLRSGHDLVRWLRGMYGILDLALSR